VRLNLKQKNRYHTAIWPAWLCLSESGGKNNLTDAPGQYNGASGQPGHQNRYHVTKCPGVPVVPVKNEREIIEDNVVTKSHIYTGTTGTPGHLHNNSVTDIDYIDKRLSRTCPGCPRMKERAKIS
jgi:hypothetical protein